MRILIIGNGFDICHGLPTTYGDFIDCLNGKTQIEIYSKIIKKFQHILDNKIIQHLQSKKDLQNWVDIKYELRKIIDILFLVPKYCDTCSLKTITNLEPVYKINPDKYYKESLLLRNFNVKLLNRGGNDAFITSRYTDYTYILKSQYEIAKQKFKDDFSELVEVFAFYINEVNQLPCKAIKCFQQKYEKVLTFNYTNTFNKLYKIPEENICHIHGKALDETHNNIVLGVGSDYFDEQYHQDSLEFFKFFQRIYKDTDTQYNDWISNTKGQFGVDIYGHSLDYTDGDVIKSFILHKWANTKIYYYDDNAKKQIIANLTKMLGKEEVIDKMLSSNKIKLINCSKFQ